MTCLFLFELHQDKRIRSHFHFHKFNSDSLSFINHWNIQLSNTYNCIFITFSFVVHFIILMHMNDNSCSAVYLINSFFRTAKATHRQTQQHGTSSNPAFQAM